MGKTPGQGVDKNGLLVFRTQGGLRDFNMRWTGAYKSIIIVGLLLYAPFIFAYDTCVVTENGDVSYTVNVNAGPTHTWILYQNGRSIDWGGNYVDMFAYRTNETLSGSFDLDDLTGWNPYEFVKADGTYHVIVYINNDWNLWSYADAIASHSAIINSACDFFVPQTAVPPGDNTATTTTATTTALDFRENLFIVNVFLFFVSFIGWAYIFRPLTQPFNA